ncbi:MAG: DUF1311 domain-containing protein [Neisseriaceae bacterium]|nr:DUF1311 domain-containing protein [Neisseriaceae bacterium]MBQ9724318.1 DUF1311 domain-containing protein [Neisseriaceae bacterium]
MKNAMILTAVISAIFAGSACAKTPVKTPLKTPEKLIQCTREMSNYEYLECVQKNNEIYEKQINKVYSELKIKLKNEDNDDITLTKSQKAWKIYRDNQCKLANSTKVVGYPTGAGVVLYAEECINSFNENRLKELNTLKSDIEEFEKEQ